MELNAIHLAVLAEDVLALVEADLDAAGIKVELDLRPAPITGKSVYIACAYGSGGYSGGPLAAYDLMRSYLILLFGFVGFTEVHFLSVEATTADADTVARNLGSAKQRAKTTIAA